MRVCMEISNEKSLKELVLKYSVQSSSGIRPRIKKKMGRREDAFSSLFLSSFGYKHRNEAFAYNSTSARPGWHCSCSISN